MWDWLLKREAGREKPATSLVAERLVSHAYQLEASQTAQSSERAGLCNAGIFANANELSDEPTLRRALDYFMASLRQESIVNSVAVNRSLQRYLSKVTAPPFLLTFGWYEFAGQSRLRHSRELAHQVLAAPTADNMPLLHVWLTSTALEIVDVTMPFLIDPGIKGSDDQALAFYFRSPSTRDSLIYHPTAYVGDTDSYGKNLENTAAVIYFAEDNARK